MSGGGYPKFRNDRGVCIIAMRIDAGPPFSALFTLWLSIMAAVGLLPARLALGTPQKARDGCDPACHRRSTSRDSRTACCAVADPSGSIAAGIRRSLDVSNSAQLSLRNGRSFVVSSFTVTIHSSVTV